MQIVDNSTVEYNHFFLQGYRAQSPDAGPAGTDVEKIAALVIKQGMDSSGNVLNDKEVLLSDSFYDPTDTKFIRMESDIAPTKPGLDIVVVDTIGDLPELLAPKPFFGDVEIMRTSGTSQTLTLLDFGWRPRADSPGRRDEAGDAGSFAPDVNQPEKLPPDFVNTFFNGGRLAETSPTSSVSSGDRIVFVELELDGVTPSGFVFDVIIPPAPQLTISIDDTPLDPQPSFEYAVDTVVLDRTSVEALFTWRAVIPWDDAYGSAVLEIT